jgi:ribosomal-protein-alanine acetyltransferase
LTVEIAPARLSDATAMAEMSRALVEDGLPWSWTPDRLARAIRHSETEVIAAKDSGRLLGFAVLRLFDEEAHLLLFAVDAEVQRTGLGRQMIEWLEELARAAGIRSVHLEVRSRNRKARAFYRALGYLEVGVRRRYYSGVEDAVLMACSTRVRERLSRRPH